MEMQSHDESHESDVFDVRSILSNNLELLMRESRDKHGCPDFTSILPSLVDALVSVCAHHPALDNWVSEELFQKLYQSILQKLYDVVGEELFTEANIRQRRFMINAWAGLLANTLSNACRKDK